MWQRCDYQFAIFFVINRASSDATAPGLIDFTNFRFRGDDLRRGRVIGRFDVRHQIRDTGLWIIEHVDTRAQYFIEIMRRNVGRHTDGDTGTAIEQQVRNLSG